MDRKLKLVCLFTICVVLTTLVIGCKKKESAPDTSSKPAVIKLSYANFPPASTFPCVQMERWKTEVEKRTNGKVQIDTYPGGTLLDAKDIFDGVVNSQADIGCFCMAYQPGRFMVTDATSLPLGIPNAKVGSLVLCDLFDKYKPAAFDKVKVLTMFTTATSNIMSKKPIRNLEDLKGVDLRAAGGAAVILEAWGANLVGMPMSDTPEALQKGVVQGLFSSIEVMKDYNYAEFCKYVTMTDTVIYPFAVVMNLDSYNKLPVDVKAVLNDLYREQALWTGAYMDDHVTESIQWAKEKHNVETIILSPEEKQKWNNLLAPMVDNWITEANAKGFDGEAIVKDLKAFIEKYSK